MCLNSNFKLIGAGTQVVALAHPSLPGKVVKIPRDDRILDRRFRRRIDYAWQRYMKRRDKQSVPVAAMLAVWDALVGREAKERKDDFLALLPKLARIARCPQATAHIAQFEVLPEISIASIDGRPVRYIGPAILQDRIGRMFAPERLDVLTAEDLRKFMDVPLKSIHEALWRLGLGFAATGEAWGPENWGIDASGRIVLVDLGGITDRKARVLAVVSSKAGDHVEAKLASRLPPDLVRRHIADVRSAINVEGVERLWRTGIQAADAAPTQRESGARA